MRWFCSNRFRVKFVKHTTLTQFSNRWKEIRVWKIDSHYLIVLLISNKNNKRTSSPSFLSFFPFVKLFRIWLNPFLLFVFRFVKPHLFLYFIKVTIIGDFSIEYIPWMIRSVPEGGEAYRGGSRGSTRLLSIY